MARVAQEDFARHADDKMMNEHLKKVFFSGYMMYHMASRFSFFSTLQSNSSCKNGVLYPFQILEILRYTVE